MGSAGEASDDPDAVPARQTWPPARRRSYVVAFTVISIGNAVLAVAWLSVDEMAAVLRVASLVLYGGLAVVTAWIAWKQSTARIEADSEGLRLVGFPRTSTYRWDDISQIRPSIVRGKRTYLVLVRHDGRTVDLPVTEEHLGALRRWHQAAT